MSCFSLDFWFKVCIAVVLIWGLWMMIKLFLPYLQDKVPPIVVSIVHVLIKVGIAILCVVIIFFFLSCIWGLVSGMFGGGLPRSFRSGDLGAFYAAGVLLARPRLQAADWKDTQHLPRLLR